VEGADGVTLGAGIGYDRRTGDVRPLPLVALDWQPRPDLLLRGITLMFLGELCGLRPLLESPELRTARQNPNIMADRITRAWLAWLRAEAVVEPVLLVLDDLQWSDAQTASRVGGALRELEGLPFMVLALARPPKCSTYPRSLVATAQHAAARELAPHGHSPSDPAGAR
jgi:hypothetical protein